MQDRVPPLFDELVKRSFKVWRKYIFSKLPDVIPGRDVLADPDVRHAATAPGGMSASYLCGCFPDDLGKMAAFRTEAGVVIIVV